MPFVTIANRLADPLAAALAALSAAGDAVARERVARALLHDRRWVAAALGAATGAADVTVLAEGPGARILLHRGDPAGAVASGGPLRWSRYAGDGTARLWRWRINAGGPLRPVSLCPLHDGTVVRVDPRYDMVRLRNAPAMVTVLSIELPDLFSPVVAGRAAGMTVEAAMIVQRPVLRA